MNRTLVLINIQSVGDLFLLAKHFLVHHSTVKTFHYCVNLVMIGRFDNYLSSSMMMLQHILFLSFYLAHICFIFISIDVQKQFHTCLSKLFSRQPDYRGYWLVLSSCQSFSKCN